MSVLAQRPASWVAAALRSAGESLLRSAERLERPDAFTAPLESLTPSREYEDSISELRQRIARYY